MNAWKLNHGAPRADVPPAEPNPLLLADEEARPEPLTEARDLAEVILARPDAAGTLAAWLEDLPELPDLLQSGAEHLEESSGDLEELVLTLRQAPDAPPSLEDLTARVNALMSGTALLLAAVADLLALTRRRARRATKEARP